MSMTKCAETSTGYTVSSSATLMWKCTDQAKSSEDEHIVYDVPSNSDEDEISEPTFSNSCLCANEAKC